MEQKEWYSIRQVARLTGLSAQLIRKWEERYRAVLPRRLTNGYRVYDARDVMRLKQLQGLVSDGYSISHAVMTLDQTKLGQRVLTDDSKVDFRGADISEDTETFAIRSQIDRLLQLAQKGESREIHSLLQRDLLIYGLDFLFYKMVVPFLHEIDSLWESGVWSEHQEHLASQSVRDFLVQTQWSIKESSKGPLLLAACVPGERHEIMLHYVLLYAALKGYKTAFLGASNTFDEIEDSLLQMRPQMVVFSLTTTWPLVSRPKLLDELDQLASRHRDIEFYIGGEAAKGHFHTTFGHSLQFSESISKLFSGEAGVW